MTADAAPFLYAYDSDCLKIRAIGRHIIEDKEAAALAIAAVIASCPVRAAILDLREVTGNYTFMDRVQLGEVAGRHLSGTPFAVILREDQADPDRIGKIVAVNRGANVEVFTDEAAAWVWVQKYLSPAV